MNVLVNARNLIGNRGILVTLHTFSLGPHVDLAKYFLCPGTGHLPPGAQGLIQAFEFTHELAWNVLRDYFVYQGNAQIIGSCDATRGAFGKGLISDGDVWMEMIQSRNRTSHTYNRAIADDIVDKT